MEEMEENGVPELDGGGKEGVFVGLSSGIGHQEFHLWTLGCCVGYCESAASWRDINQAAHDFIHYGGLGDSAGFSVCPTSTWLQVQRHCLWHCSPARCSVPNTSTPSPGNQTSIADVVPTYT